MEPGVVRLAALDVRVVDIPYLGVPGLLLHEYSLALVDQYLSARDREDALSHLLDRALAWAEGPG